MTEEETSGANVGRKPYDACWLDACLARLLGKARRIRPSAAETRVKLMVCCQRPGAEEKRPFFTLKLPYVPPSS